MKKNYRKQLMLVSAIQTLALVVIAGMMLIACSVPEGTEGTTTLTTSQTTTQITTEETTEEITEETTIPVTESTVAELEPNPFNKEDFVRDGHFIRCTAENTAIGIDVSSWQGNIDWKKVKAAGVDYVMIRAAGRYTSWSGGLFSDDYTERNYLGAKEAGLKVGFYIFSQARNVTEARQEAEYILNIVKDWEVDLPLVIDWEYVSYSSTPRIYGMSKRKVTDCVKTFCQTVEAAGYKAMFYCVDYSANNKLYLDELTDYGIWFADYLNYLDFPYKVDMWQYTDRGRVSGIAGNVDINVVFLEDTVFSDIF